MIHSAYNCIYCGNEFHSLEELKSHLQFSHPEVPFADIKEILKDFKKHLHREKLKIKKLKNKQKREKIEEKRTKDLEKERNEFLEYQSKILLLLNKNNAKDAYLKQVLDSKNLISLKNRIKHSFNEETISMVKDAGFDLNTPKKRKRAKSKSKIAKYYFDKSLNSIRAIITPMGNKR